jgi:hypothetical protein
MNRTPKSTSTASIHAPFFLPSDFARLLARPVIPQLSRGISILAVPLTRRIIVSDCRPHPLEGQFRSMSDGQPRRFSIGRQHVRDSSRPALSFFQLACGPQRGLDVSPTSNGTTCTL